MSTGTGKRTFFRNLIILLGLACMVVAGYSSFEVSNKAREDQSNIQAVANLRVKSLRITQLARNASAGDEQAFDSLTTLNAQMNNGWTGLKNRLGGGLDRMAPLKYSPDRFHCSAAQPRRQ
jgi:twitching motility protein PilJ